MLTDIQKACEAWAEDEGLTFVFQLMGTDTTATVFRKALCEVFAAGVAWQRGNEDFDHLLETARRILDQHYPRDTIVCSPKVLDVGPRFTAALRDLVDKVDAVIAKRAKGEIE